MRYFILIILSLILTSCFAGWTQYHHMINSPKQTKIDKSDCSKQEHTYNRGTKGCLPFEIMKLCMLNKGYIYKKGDKIIGIWNYGTDCKYDPYWIKKDKEAEAINMRFWNEYSRKQVEEFQKQQKDCESKGFDVQPDN